MFEIIGKMTLYILGTLFCGLIMNPYDFDTYPVSFAAAWGAGVFVFLFIIL